MRVLTVWLTLTFAGADVTVDVGGSIAVHAALPTIQLGKINGITLGPLVLINPHGDNPRHTIRHELEHVSQWEVLGPAFPLAYLLTAGREFEGYLPGGRTWIPPAELARCPLLRISSNELQFMPCWRFTPA